MENLKELQSSIDEIYHHNENKDNVFPEGEYLKMMDLCKKIYEYVIEDRHLNFIRGFLAHHHEPVISLHRSANDLLGDFIRCVDNDRDSLDDCRKIIVNLLREKYEMDIIRMD